MYMSATKKVLAIQSLKHQNKMRAKSNKPRQRGAIRFIGVIALLLLIIFLAVVVDSSRLWMLKRQLQTVADISAIEAAKGLTGCSVSLDDMLTRANQAAAANGYTGNIMVETGSVNAAKDVSISHFTKDASARAVHIKVTKTVTARLTSGGIFGHTVTLAADAVALPSSSSTALTINSQDSDLLNALLSEMLNTQTPINLDVIGYQGMANTNITLANLIKAEGTMLSVGELLKLELNAGQWLSLISSAIRLTDTINTDSPLLRVVNDTSHLANKAGNNTEINFSLDKILNINPNSQTEALNAPLNVLNLVNITASMANGNSAMDIPLEVNLLSLSAPTNAFWVSDAECI